VSRVLGVDPGSLVTGWGVVVESPGRVALETCGAIRLRPELDLASRLARLHREFEDLVAELAPDAAAVETPFHGSSARSALQLAHARGVILAVLGRAGLAVGEYSPAQVKKSISGNGRADKSQVGAMVRRLLGLDARGAGHDVQDALAVAWCHLATVRFLRAVGGSSLR
jgi:crossover junction endodeoxyribonuclease RuvC